MTQFLKLISLSLLIIFCIGCKEKEVASKVAESPAHPKTEIKDAKAAQLVSSMMAAMGGEDNWNELSFVSWSFFGARHLVWDKKGGRVRIDSPRDTSIYLVDLNTQEGKVIKGGKEVTEPKELAKLLKRAKGIWINDSYWLFMPFKLQDPGVTVDYMREDTMIGGVDASVLALTFDNVGNTPENKYEVYLDKKDNLIKQWAYFKDADQETPPRIWPWDNYQSHNGLNLSSERSDKSGPSNIRIYETLEDKVFDSFDLFDYF